MISSALLLGCLVAATQPEPTRLALVIANNQSLDRNVKALRFADDDAARLFELLSGLGYDGRLLTVLDEDGSEVSLELCFWDECTMKNEADGEKSYQGLCF